MDQIIPMIFDEMGSDNENDSQELVEYYNGASSEALSVAVAARVETRRRRRNDRQRGRTPVRRGRPPTDGLPHRGPACLSPTPPCSPSPRRPCCSCRSCWPPNVAAAAPGPVSERWAATGRRC